jgi:hypothetical protein
VPRIEATRHHCLVTITRSAVGSDASSATLYLEALAPATKEIDGLELDISAKHQLSRLSEALGFEDVQLGHSELDRALAVHSNDPALARLWLGAAERRAIQTAPSFSYILRNGKVRTTGDSTMDNIADVSAALEATARLAGRGKALQAKWRGLARRLGASTMEEHEPWPDLELPQGGVPITVGIRRGSQRRPRWLTTLRCPLPSTTVEAFLITTDVDADVGTLLPIDNQTIALPPHLMAASALPEATQKRLTTERIDRLTKVEPRRLDHDGRWLQAELEGIVLDDQRIANAIALMAELATPAGQGPSR